MSLGAVASAEVLGLVGVLIGDTTPHLTTGESPDAVDAELRTRMG